MRLFWASARSGIGGLYGYTTHQRKLGAALAAAGVSITDDPVGADYAVHIVHPHEFQPTPGLPNVLFTTCETNTLPANARGPIQAADVLVVPSRFCRNVFAAHYKRQVHLCWLGVDPVEYPFFQRRVPAAAEPFVYLFVGTLGLRKGSEALGRAWKRWTESGRRPKNTRLLYKTTGTAHGDVRTFGDATLDGRDLAQPELRKVYEAAHAFCIPSLGEGFGLTAAEAAASGLPVLYTRWAGMKDFLDADTAYPLKFKLTPVRLGEGDSATDTHAAMPDEQDLVRQMERVYRGYEHALNVGKRASDFIHSAMTWERTATRFIEILQGAVSANKP